jgi:hypothetical protein
MAWKGGRPGRKKLANVREETPQAGWKPTVPVAFGDRIRIDGQERPTRSDNQKLLYALHADNNILSS